MRRLNHTGRNSVNGFRSNDKKCNKHDKIGSVKTRDAGFCAAAKIKRAGEREFSGPRG
jgi:hypothetical protein